MTEEKFLESVLSGLDDFSPGDLVSAMEMKELIDSNKNSFPADGKEIFLDLAAVFHCFILEGDNDDLKGKLEQLKSLIEGRWHTSLSERIAKEQEDIGPSTVLIEDDEVLLSFIQESHDHLDTIEDRIITLENDDDPDLIDDIFRSMHTIKGVASFIGLNNIKNLSHKLESLLDRLRIKEVEINPEMINILLEGTDVLVNMIQFIESEASIKGEGRHSYSISESSIDLFPLYNKIKNISNPGAIPEPVTLAVDKKNNSQSLDDLITDDMIQKFVEESVDLLDSAEHSILELENSGVISENVDNAFRNLHTIKGNSGFFGFADIEKTSMDAENLLDKIRVGEKRADQRNISQILQRLDQIRNQIVRLTDPGTHIKKETEKDPYKPLGEVLEGMGVLKDDIEHAAELQNKKLGEILVDEGVVSRSILDKALESQNKSSSGVSSSSIKRKDIRIDMEKLDKLFDMVGELITAEAMVVDSEDLVGMDLRDFNKSALYLSKITREIQSITMSMRMIPLEGLFNKMKRLVRDLSKKMDKPVQFLISGADTEMDRNVTEEISDPLVHIIRNSIDHGLENKADRKKSGKDPVGIIDLNARYEGNEIWITVKDDGAGLNTKKILKNAMSKGLIKGQPGDMEPKDIWNLIFEPGFSTVDKVSEISGRGVGMDVVRRNIEKLRGQIDINTIEGAGTEIILRIPMTLAIIDAISCRLDNMIMALQSTDVIEFLKPKDDSFTDTGKGRIVINLRNEIIPVIDMNQFYNINNGREKIEDGVIIVICAGGVKTALVVDEILGSKQMVVKALPEILEESRAISGCSLLGNGEVCLIIDAAALVKETLE
jgi:two-component system chemotaxis sensor kinase CheA